MNTLSIFDKTLRPGTQARVWQCPECNHEHLIVVMDKTARRMMQENKKDRDRIGGINKQASMLKQSNQSNQLNDGQANTFLTQTENLWKKIKKRTTELEARTQRLADEYKETL